MRTCNTDLSYLCVLIHARISPSQTTAACVCSLVVSSLDSYRASAPSAQEPCPFLSLMFHALHREWETCHTCLVPEQWLETLDRRQSTSQPVSLGVGPCAQCRQEDTVQTVTQGHSLQSPSQIPNGNPTLTGFSPSLTYFPYA